MKKRQLKPWVVAVLFALSPVLFTVYVKFTHDTLTWFFPQLTSLEVGLIIFVSLFAFSMYEYMREDNT